MPGERDPRRRRPRRRVDVRHHAVVDQRPDGTWSVRVPALGVAVEGDTEQAAWAALHPALASVAEDADGRTRLEAFADAHGEEVADEPLDLSVAEALQALPSLTADDLAAAIAAGDTLLVNFWADWCAPCKAMAPALLSLAAELNDRARLAKLNVDDHPRAADAHEVRSLPTLALFRHGAEKLRVVGVQSHDELLAALEPALG